MKQVSSPEAGETELGWLTLRGGAVTLAAQAIRFALQFVSLVVLARLLTPNDFGLYGLAIAITALVNMFKDQGLGLATIQRAKISQKQISALFWVNAVIGGGLALATVAGAPVVAWLYGEPKLVPILVILALGYIAIGMTVQPQSVMRRQMRFGVLALIDVIAVALALGVAIAAAVKGAGYWSLVAMQSVLLFVTAISTWLTAGWRPDHPTWTHDVRSLIRFGGHITATNLVGYLNRNADNLLIGWRWGMQQVGWYDKAYQLLLLPLVQINTPLANVAVPVLSRLQNDAPRYRAYFARWVILCASLGMPLIAFLFITADRVIPLVLGEQWIPSVSLFRALAPAAFMDAFTPLLGWVYISLGHTARQLRAVTFYSLFTLGGFLIGVQWGALGVALAYSVCRVIIPFPLLMDACAGSPLRWNDVLRAVARPAAASGAALIGTLLVLQLRPAAPPESTDLAVDAIAYGLFYVAAWMIPPGGKETVQELLVWSGSVWRKRHGHPPEEHTGQIEIPESPIG